MVAKLKAIKAELQRRKHHRTTEVGAWLRKVVLGYYQYHAVPGNSTQLRIFCSGCGTELTYTPDCKLTARKAGEGEQRRLMERVTRIYESLMFHRTGLWYRVPCKG